VDKLPSLGLPKHDFREISAEEGGTLNKLIRHWANTPLPHGNEASEKRFTDIIKASGSLVLVLQDAHLLWMDKVLSIAQSIFFCLTESLFLIGAHLHACLH
jgi:hypothetical protein